MDISRPTAYKWVRRWRAEGEAGLYDRSSRPYATPLRTTPPAREEEVCELRRSRKLGPTRIGPIQGMPASTVHRVLVRHGLNRLAFMDRPTGQVIRRYERDQPAELVHVDVKKLGRIPDGGGHRVLGRRAGRTTRKSMGFDYPDTRQQNVRDANPTRHTEPMPNCPQIGDRARKLSQNPNS
ncbi:hypothetical protein GCM10009646_58060 [Streptomyces aureus]